MTNNLRFPIKDQREKHRFLLEVANTEKQLWALICTKGLLDTDVRDLYHKVCSSYEKILLGDYEQQELQDVEYSLWKLHYKQIDEFRKRTKKNSSGESTKLGIQQNTNHIEGFRRFLSEAIEFYQNLIVKIRKCHNLPGGSMFCEKGSTSVEPQRLQKCQFLCHRFLVCLGDLARYREQYEKPKVQEHNWSVAASHYMEATAIWPDSGNPQNQLAVLATYVGDEFLALYHCIRSLAVKEPFPDARDNLIVLLERNRSSFSESPLSEVHFNFLEPSERSISKMKSNSSDGLSYANAVSNFWFLIIRIISFFFIKSSLEEFPCAFTCSMKELDALMELDDAQLVASLESYQHMDSVRTGPFRALQVVSIFLYTLQNLTNTPETKELKDIDETQLILQRQWALTSTFIFMGRFVDRCLKASSLNYCPLLSAILVFIEWLAIKLDEVEKYGVDEKSRSAMSYFFGSFVDLLRRFNVYKNEGNLPDITPLWEDYELRGFVPVTCSHESMDFSSHWENRDDYEAGIETRVHRIISAGIKMASRSNDAWKWIIYNQSTRTFQNPSVAEFDENLDRKDSEKAESIHSDVQDEDDLSANVKSVNTEEEEVILFKPLTRYNSAPICTNSNDPTSPKEMEDPFSPSDDCLCRATSLLIAQNKARGNDPSTIQVDITNFGHKKSFKQQEQPFPDAPTPISAGPPSLSAWVLDPGSLNNNGKDQKPTSGVTKQVLSPIEEAAFESLNDLSISENEDYSVNNHSFSNTLYSPSPYSAPVPSAPLLPDDAVWFTGIQSRTEANSCANWTAASQVAAPDYSRSIPGFSDEYPPTRRMTSSEWLRQYRETHNLEPSYNYGWPAYFYAPVNRGNLYGHEASKFDLLDQFVNPLASNPPIQMENPPLHPAFPLDYGAAAGREKFIYGYQRPSPYGCGAVTDMGNEPQPLIHYLKEKERQLQMDPSTLIRGPPTYMGN
ncbi:hypothetical protein UlMin_018422 [Ulmus minor]